ncbi:extracellular catalytic domain type 2 short-chain-length polyhydroxyalkanoate depolymerase [Paraburkholderia sp. HD33-4]|uniref:extracellular catalytic domain type 2 short-chain-length polyhydroxyalkanoate depolymerase n=1 Tax=Paraburkholderia sp. HD33-4 TaxID=2883242 RepID=UPI001F358974|nr:prolyl oligopeptidase family serine peptidase [Paraburkholderia sp. HD33-4]
MMTKASGLRSALAFVLAIGLAGCGGGGDSAGTDVDASKLSAKTLAAASNPAANDDSATSRIVKLQRYQIDPTKVFVAGISSGGFAAVQMHVAHSSTFKGAAIYAGGVYWCAGAGGAATALENCGGLTLPTNHASYNNTLTTSEAYLDTQSSLGTIDRATNLRGQPVYLWSGTQDEVVNPLEMADLDAEYLRYGANVRFDNGFPAEHGWESPDGELACGTLGSPYMIRCLANGAAYDSVETWLTMFLGRLKPRNNGKLSGTLYSFYQSEFGASPNLSMSSTGSVFVPKACAQGDRCGFVLALHGCLQQASLIGNRWVTEAGINEWADTNKLVVVYPDTIASSAPGPTNPNACFDWWGYSNQYDPNYALRSGLQMSVLYAMVQRVTGRP